MATYDYLIVGTGLFGAVCARELTNAGFKCLVIDKRAHIGGNCYTSNRDGINVHEYGAHIFHTSNREVWNWINQYANFNNYRHTVLANYRDEIYSLPFSMWTFNKLWGVREPQQAKSIIDVQSNSIDSPVNLEEQAIKAVGKEVYEKLIKGYTEKQWGRPCKDLPREIIKRLPVRFTYDNSYFNDKYQGIPEGGYTQIFEKLLEGVEVELKVDYLKLKKQWNSKAKEVIYTGPIDEFYDYKFGELEYKTLKFEHILCDFENYQGTAVVNYTDSETPFTRIIEHKHFESTNTLTSWITKEYSLEHKVGETEPMYPINDQKNNAKYTQYKALADNESNVYFGGRLAEYKYYDMDKVIESALNLISKIK
jgi:UDP-galactopyranose mutase